MSDDTLRVLHSLHEPPEGVIDEIEGTDLEHVGLACADCARGAYDVVIEALIKHFEGN